MARGVTGGLGWKAPQGSLILPLLRAGPALKLDQVTQGLVPLSLDTSKGGEVLNHISGHTVLQDHLHDEDLSPFVLLEFAMLQLMPIALHPTSELSGRSPAASSPDPPETTGDSSQISSSPSLPKAGPAHVSQSLLVRAVLQALTSSLSSTGLSVICEDFSRTGEP